MARDKSLEEEKRKNIAEKVDELMAVKDTRYNVRKYTDSYCFARVAEEFFLKPNTIHRIWWDEKTR